MKMPKWLRQVTYIASVGLGIASQFFPQFSTPLIGLSTFLAGYATTFASDTKNGDIKPEPKASK